jgi:hypothetical protein
MKTTKTRAQKLRSMRQVANNAVKLGLATRKNGIYKWVSGQEFVEEYKSNEKEDSVCKKQVQGGSVKW